MIDLNKIPEHVAIIMDGNGRWAKKRLLPRSLGHEEGARRISEVAICAKNIGVKAITMFAFSTENWKRPKEEVDYIFSLLERMLKKGKEKFKTNNIRVNFIGKINEIEERFRNVMLETMEETKENDGIILNLAINYGGRSDIVEATRKICKECLDGKIDIERIGEEIFEKYLMTSGLPKIDLLIRTSGELRISNFLLWQIAYSELVFTDVYWPDFKEKEFIKCIEEYQGRSRRFGGLK